jgi:hypothetical protein
MVLSYAKFLCTYLCILPCSTSYGLLAKLELWNLKMELKLKQYYGVHGSYSRWDNIANITEHHGVLGKYSC